MRSRWFGVLLFAAALVSGCTDEYPESLEYAFAPYPSKLTEGGEEKPQEFTVSPPVRQQLATELKPYFGTPASPFVKVSDSELLDRPELQLHEDNLKKGSKLYRRLCLYCHGLNGDASGPTGAFLLPKPRDFRQGFFKFKSTSKPAPSREDIKKTVRSGIPGASMPSFTLLPEEDLDHVVSYVIHLSLRGKVERLAAGLMENSQEYDLEKELQTAVENWLQDAQAQYVPQVPAGGWGKVHAESLQNNWERGRKVYEGVGACVQCHGIDGRASVLELSTNVTRRNDWGDLNPPRDLTLGVYRGGSRPLDLFFRIKLGIQGSGMPETASGVTDEDIWHLVDYVLTMPQKH